MSRSGPREVKNSGGKLEWNNATPPARTIATADNKHQLIEAEKLHRCERYVEVRRPDPFHTMKPPGFRRLASNLTRFCCVSSEELR